MKYFPLFADLKDAPVLVAGGGAQAAQRVRLLAKTHARVTIVAETVSEELRLLAARHGLPIALRAFHIDDLEGRRLVYAANGDRSRDRAVSEAARARAIPVNVVDAPELSTFIMPAIVDRAPVTVAIATEGAAPILAQEIRARLEALLPANFGALARHAQALRGRIAAAFPDLRARRHFWQRLLQGPLRHAVLAGAVDEAERLLAVELNGTAPAQRGRVALIGCGPGDPDLLTLKALQRLQEADVVVFDRLVNPQILDYARRDAERIYVGKFPRGPAGMQARINQILLTQAAAGKIVARLKGGDPLIFARAREEMAALQAAGFEVEVVPGVTAAHACAARIGLPLTLRDEVRHIVFLTGSSTAPEPDLAWQALAREDCACAIYMGVANAALLRRKLRAAGRSPATPVVIVENGTMANERAVATTLKDLAACIEALRITGPAVIFIGLDWSTAGLVRPENVRSYRRPARAPAALEVTA